LFDQLIRQPQRALSGHAQGDLLVVQVAIKPALIAVHEPILGRAGRAHALQHHLNEHCLKLLGNFAECLGRLFSGLMT